MNNIIEKRAVLTAQASKNHLLPVKQVEASLIRNEGELSLNGKRRTANNLFTSEICVRAAYSFTTIQISTDFLLL